MTIKNINQKTEFIKDYIKKHLSVDVMDSDFVDEYIEKFQPKYKIMFFGANKCPELGRLLSAMTRLGILKRSPIGLSNGAWQPGFPKWVYSYQLNGIDKTLNE